MRAKSQNLKSSIKVTELEPPLPKASLFIWIICLGLVTLLLWAWFFKL